MRSLVVAALVGATALAGPSWGQETDEDHLRRALATEVTLSFQNTALTRVLEALRAAAELNVVLAPETDGSVSVTVEGRQVRALRVLDQAVLAAGLQRTWWQGAVVVHPSDVSLPRVERFEDEGLTHRLSVNYDDLPFAEALARLQARARVEVRMGNDALERIARRGLRVRLRVWRMQTQHVLTHFTRACGLRWSYRAGAVRLSLVNDDTLGSATNPDEVVIPNGGVDGELAALDDEITEPEIAHAIARLRDFTTREAAERTLILGGARVAGPVSALLTSDNPAVLEAALRVLREVGTLEQVEAVRAVFQDDSLSLDTRTVAGLALGGILEEREGGPTAAQIRDSGVLEELIGALDNSWFKICETARVALVQIGPAALEPLVASYREQLSARRPKDGIIYRTLLILGQWGTDPCKELLLEALGVRRGSRAVSLRHHAAIGLGFVGTVDLIEPLIDALQREDDFYVQKYIARTLGWITEVQLPPDAARWRAWWERNRYSVLGVDPNDELYNPVELQLDEDGLPILGDD